MIRVMVIEDEPPILRNICQKIEAANSRFQVVATACDGREGIEKLRSKNAVDLVFVDMNLPVLSGVEVLDYIKKERPRIMAVTLSGYKDFDYVKKAYERDTVDYLLKPLREEELKELLAKIERACAEREFKKDSRTLSEALKSPERQRHAEDKEYYMTLLTLGSYHNALLGNGIDYERYFLDLSLPKLLETFFESASYWIISGKSEMDWILFLEAGAADAAGKTGKLFDSLPLANLPVTMTMNQKPLRAAQVYHSYYEMRKYAETGMIFGKSVFLLYDGCVMEPLLNNCKSRVDQAVAACGKQPDVKRIQKEALGLLEECVQVPTRQCAVLYMVKRFFFLLCAGLPCNREYVQAEEEIEFLLLNDDTFENMKKEICRLAEDCFGVVKSEVKDKRELAGQMKTYLEENYRYGISNRMLSEKFGFVPTYLSSIFKEYYEISLGDYLIRLRIEEAKKLLLHSGLKIREIAEKTGYGDPFYFSKAFKKAVGVSPREYMDLARKKGN